jgi:hypothetical protein
MITSGLDGANRGRLTMAPHDSLEDVSEHRPHS